MRRAIVLSSALALLGCSSVVEQHQAVANTLHAALDGPNAVIEVDPVVIRQKYAIAGWVEGQRGGRVLLHQEHGAWRIVAQGGEEVRNAQYLSSAGVPQPEASALYNMLVTAERKVPEARLAIFDRYADRKVRR